MSTAGSYANQNHPNTTTQPFVVPFIAGTPDHNHNRSRLDRRGKRRKERNERGTCVPTVDRSHGCSTDMLDSSFSVRCLCLISKFIPRHVVCRHTNFA